MLFNIQLREAFLKNNRDKHGRSKRRSGSEKSTLTDDEEIYPELKSRSKGSRRFVPETAEKGSEATRNEYFARESPSRSYGPDICKNCASNHPEMAKRKFEMPMVKRYLPMYQSPGLIEELKRHDRMKLIQEREIRKRRSGSSHRSSDAEDRNVDRSPAPDSSFKSKEKDGRLAYQESQAYKNVLREFQTRVGRQEVRKKPRNRIPLICLSEKADKSKEVEQLYPCERQARQKPNVMKKFAHKMVAPFKPPKCKKHKCKTHRGDVKFEEMEIMYDCLCDAEVLSEASSTCSCVKKTHKSGTLTSADETSDNNESIQ
ncbi:uncharacterized protein LOC132911174 [Bombus pascuorum]|uniref:uncharacterized protein LOC132911174 n=1 Tax=Bombus pascuorum TaxID=65598 RepID=UPI00298DE2F1|nr:uncharacterized protein LOC132911174 [Bombus pascuorum]